MLGMRQVAWVAATALAVGGIGCSGDDKDGGLLSPSDTDGGSDTGDDAGGSVGGSVETSVDEADLEAALLGLDDLPPGWSEVPEADEEDDPLCGVQSSELLGLEEDALPKVEVEYADDPDEGPGFFEGIVWPSEGRAAELMDEIEQKLDDCDNTEAAGMQVTVGGLSFEPIGDESFAFRVSATADGATIDLDTVYIRKGNLVMTVAGFDIGGDPTAVMAEWATKALDKATTTLGVA